VSAGVLIAGGGLAAQRCAETLRRAGYEGRVRMICAERHLPYDRPPLSKEVLGDQSEERTISFRPSFWYDDNAVELLLDVRAEGLDCTGRRILLTDGSTVDFDKLLVATGSRARTLPLLEGFSNVTTLRTIDDARQLRGVLSERQNLVIIGAGFIGQEVASAARRAGAPATVIESASAPLENVLGRSLGSWFADLHRSHGVDVLVDAQVSGAKGNGRVQSLTLSDGRAIPCDHVVVGIGVLPDGSWLADSGLDPTGLRVDVDGRTVAPDVYAAGDVALTFDSVLGRHVAGAHWESAGRQGSRAAKAMLGLAPGPVSLSSFWSDLYETRIQYLGHAHLADQVTIDGAPDLSDFTATFSRAGQPVAVLLVGRPRHLPDARAALTG
jgi:3-phenylpropionate/trans-cinnamate dioxygenase ferredoxin reductase subunit